METPTQTTEKPTEKTNGNGSGEAATEAKPIDKAIEMRPQSKPATSGGGLMPFLPRNFQEAWAQAEYLSKASLLPPALQNNPGNVLLILLTGLDLDLSPIQAIRMIHVVEGRPFIEAKLKIGKCKTSPECEYFELVETTNDRATWKTKRKGETGEQKITFTIQDANQALLIGKSNSNWGKYPAVMLRWRAASQLADLVYPDVVGGYGIEDEFDEIMAQQAQQKAPFLQRVVPDGEVPTAPVIPLQPPPKTAAQTKKSEQVAEMQTPEAEKPAKAEAPKQNLVDAPPTPTEAEALEAKIERIIAEAKNGKELASAAKLIAQVKSIDRSAHWRAEFAKKSAELNRAG